MFGLWDDKKKSRKLELSEILSKLEESVLSGDKEFVDVNLSAFARQCLKAGEEHLMVRKLSEMFLKINIAARREERCRPIRYDVFLELIKVYGIDSFTREEIKYLVSLARRWGLITPEEYASLAKKDDSLGQLQKDLENVITTSKGRFETELRISPDNEYDIEFNRAIESIRSGGHTVQERIQFFEKLAHDLAQRKTQLNSLMEQEKAIEKKEREDILAKKLATAPTKVGEEEGERLLQTGERYWDTDQKKLSDLQDEDIQLFNECTSIMTKPGEDTKGIDLSLYKNLRELKDVKRPFRRGGFIYLYDENPEIYVIGDLHGYFVNLKAALSSGQTDFFKRIHENKNCKIIFIGDYIDRGGRSSEVVRTVCLLQKNFPENLFMLRGNHEELYRVEKPDENGGKLFASGTSPDDWLQVHQDILKPDYFSAFISLQDNLISTLSVVTPFGTILFTHGGIIRPDRLESFKDLEFFATSKEVAYDMRWSDPVPGRDEVPPMKDCRFGFGLKQFEQFMNTVGADYLVRGHEAIEEGCSSIWNGRLWTVFSAGGKENADGDAYDEVTPHYLSISARDGKMYFEPKEILYHQYSKMFKELLEKEKATETS